MDGEGEEEDIFVISPFAWGDSEISQWDFDLSQENLGLLLWFIFSVLCDILFFVFLFCGIVFCTKRLCCVY